VNYPMKKPSIAQGQSKAFVEAARELGCDESEERFDAALKRVAGHKEVAAKKAIARPARASRKSK
jgi:hypothetical protein